MNDFHPSLFRDICPHIKHLTSEIDFHTVAVVYITGHSSNAVAEVGNIHLLLCHRRANPAINGEYQCEWMLYILSRLQDYCCS